MLTAKGKYGLKALAHLALPAPEATTQAVDIAKANNIPKKFLDATSVNCATPASSVAERAPAAATGSLARPPSKIKIGHVIRTIDGPLAPIACASRTAYQPCRDCKNVNNCNVRLLMTRVRDAMSDVLDRVTLEDMVKRRGRAR